MLGWSGMDVSPDKDASIEKIQLKKGLDFTSPNEGALVNGNLYLLSYNYFELCIYILHFTSHLDIMRHYSILIILSFSAFDGKIS